MESTRASTARGHPTCSGRQRLRRLAHEDGRPGRERVWQRCVHLGVKSLMESLHPRAAPHACSPSLVSVPGGCCHREWRGGCGPGLSVLWAFSGLAPRTVHVPDWDPPGHACRPSCTNCYFSIQQGPRQPRRAQRMGHSRARRALQGLWRRPACWAPERKTVPVRPEGSPCPSPTTA